MQEKTVKSAVRVLAIFEAFEAEQRALTISELVDILQIPQSSTSTLMKSPVTKSFVEFDAPTRRYRPSVRLAFLGNWVLGSTDVIARIHALAQRLSEETGETVLVGAENGLHLQYLSVIVSPHFLRFALHPGLMRPLHRAGLGVMLLSEKSDAEIGRMIRRYNAEITDPREERMSNAQVFDMVGLARAQGWFESASLATEGAGSLATLLPLPRGQGTLAIGIGAPLSRLQARSEELRGILLASVAAFRNSLTVDAEAC